MKKLLLGFSFIVLFVTGCSKTEPNNVLRLPTTPSGEFIVLKSGVLAGQNTIKLFGNVEFGIDGSNNYLVHLLSDFTTDFSSNVNTLLLSKTGVYDAKTDLPITLLNANGEKYFKISAAEFNAFSNLILLNTASNTTIASSVLKIVDTSTPLGALTVQRTGTFVHQNGSPLTVGSVQIGVDAAGEQWLKFSADFSTETTTASLVALSKSVVYATPTIQSVGAITKTGAQYYKIKPSVGTDFTHVIIWCSAAKIAFGNAGLK